MVRGFWGRMLNAKTYCSVAAIGLALGCSWDYPAWPKSKLSDTPLFLFVTNDRGGAGYIDRAGKIVIPPRYDAEGNQGGDFFEGLALVRKPNGRTVFIDATGAEAMDGQQAGYSEFSEGLLPEYSPQMKKFGYLDRRGKRVIALQFDAAGPFREGLAHVSTGGRYGFIDHTGKTVIPARFHHVTPFSEGLAVVIEKGSCVWRGYGPCDGWAKPMPTCKYSVIDKTGNIVWRSGYVDAKPYSQGLAAVGNGTKWGFVDKTGAVRIPLQFDDAGSFSEGLASVRIGDNQGFIDLSGKFVIRPQFYMAYDFSEGMAVVTDPDYNYWFIDRTGKRAFGQTFGGAAGFVMGLAHIRLDQDQWAYIDKTGKIVFRYRRVVG